MKLAKSILYGATALVFVAGSALANEEFDVLLEPSFEAQAGATTIYGVDDDRDGRTDRLLILEESDTLA